MPTPYITRQPNELIRAADWNNIQVQAREEIQGHGHSGGEDGVQLETEAIADGAVTSDKLDSQAVTEAKLADHAVTSDKLATDAVTEDKLHANAVHEHHLIAGAVTSDKLDNGAVTGWHISANAVTEWHISENAVTTVKLYGEAVTTEKLADGAVTETKLAVDAVNTAQIRDGSITAEKLAPGVGGGGPLPSPLAVDITGSTVRSIPVAPVFDCFSLTIPRINGAILRMPPYSAVDMSPLLTDLVDSFVSLVPDGTSVLEASGRALARAVSTVIDNVPWELIEQFGQVQGAHEAVVTCLPAYAEQLAVLTAQANGDVISPALELLQMIEGWLLGPSVRSFGYAFASQLGAMFQGHGGSNQLLVVFDRPNTIGDLTSLLAPAYPELYAGRMQPMLETMGLRIVQPEGNTGGAMLSCEALVTVGFVTDAPCVIGIGTGGPPPPGQVVFVSNPQLMGGAFARPVQSTYVRRSVVRPFVDPALPMVPHSLWLWAAALTDPGVVEAHDLMHARLDCHHVLLEDYGTPTVIP